jgi:bifunctional oligoribonuclease and PAP phosphatase NrnA
MTLKGRTKAPILLLTHKKMNNERLIAEIRQTIHGADKILVTSHIRPDGDAIGSVLGMGLALKAIGKTIQMVLNESSLKNFGFLEGINNIQQATRDNYDLAIIMDCGDKNRISASLETGTPQINIDHHITNDNFSQINLVEPQEVSTTAILAKYFPEWGLEISQPVASALLCGLLTDTLGFRTNNMNPKALRIAADMMEAGADIISLYNKALTSRSIEAAHYWGQGLNKDHLHTQNGIVWTSLSLNDRRIASYRGNDDANLIDLVSTIEKFDISVIFTEQRKNSVKVSWRARSGIDISKLARQFGGGGHPSAAGASITGSLEEVQKRVLKATHGLIEN